MKKKQQAPTLFDVDTKVQIRQEVHKEIKAIEFMDISNIGLNASYRKHGFVPVPSSIEIVKIHFDGKDI